MSFDCSRFQFNPLNDYLGVVMQQGRVQLDSDWNEWQSEFARRLQAGTLDTMGRAAYPATTPQAFAISALGDDKVTIGAGRMYVDGLLAENHGIVPPAFTVVAQPSLSNPGACGIEIAITDSATGQFTLTLVQFSGATSKTVGSIAGLTVKSVQEQVASNATLSSNIEIQSVAAHGLPWAATKSNPYMLVFNGSAFQAVIPSQPDPASQTVVQPVSSPLQWDPALAEKLGASAIDYYEQPYYPNAPQLPASGNGLFYLDVWQRPVTYLEDPNLVDVAVGVDTTGRLQTVWQVRCLKVSSEAQCCTKDSGLSSEWNNLLQPPGVLLTTNMAQTGSSGPCCMTPNTAYTGVENQLYRVEIHQTGALPSKLTLPLVVSNTTPTFKWSRDNGSVATAVNVIGSKNNSLGVNASTLTVQSLGRDKVLGFCPGDWIEITDDWQELAGTPGELHKIDSVQAPNTVILADVTSAHFPIGLTDPNRHTRITRWNQSGQIYYLDGAGAEHPYFNLDTEESNGLLQGNIGIPVPPAGTTLILENGITITFNETSAGTQPKTGDFWTFAARTANGSVQILQQAPPQGIYHHYARLALVTFPNVATDCRTPWPPRDCDCQTKPAAAEKSGDDDLPDVVGPMGTPDDGFKITLDLAGIGSPPVLWSPPSPLGSPPAPIRPDFLISPGTMFVGGQKAVFPDPSSSQSGRFWYSYLDQPDWAVPAAPPNPLPAQEVAYLRLFEQKVSGAEDPNLAERVRLMRRVERCAGGSCDVPATLWGQNGFELDRKTRRLLPQAKLQVTRADPLAAGCRARAIRVEIRNIHGSPPQPTLLWRYEDQDFIWRVPVPPTDQLTLKLQLPPGRATFQPAANQTVEILGTAAVLGNYPDTADPQSTLRCVAEATGEIHTLKPSPAVAGGQPTVILATPLTESYPAVLPLFLRTWEQEHPLTSGASVVLTDANGRDTGLSVTVSWDGTDLPDGAFWMIALRPDEAEWVYPEGLRETPQPPDGPKQWMCPLAVIDWTDGPPAIPGTIYDCRKRFLNLVELTRKVGCCSISLRPEDLEGDDQSLQKACDWLAAKGASGAAICLAPGTYSLRQTVQLAAQHSGLTIEGCHGAAILQASPDGKFSEGLIAISGGNNITLDGLTFRCAVAQIRQATNNAPAPWVVGLGVQDSEGLTVTNCQFTPAPGAATDIPFGAGILASGNCQSWVVRGNRFTGPLAPGKGVSFGFILAPASGSAVLENALFSLNQFQSLSVALLISAADTGAVAVRENSVTGCFGGFWFGTMDLTGQLKIGAATESFFSNIAAALGPLTPAALKANTGSPQIQVSHNRMSAPANPSAYALLIYGDSMPNSSAMVNANDLRGNWYSYVALVSDIVNSSITGNVVLNLAAVDPGGKTPLSLGVFNSPSMAVTGNVLNCRSNLGPGFPQRTDITLFDNTTPALAQLNTWKFLNFEQPPPPLIRRPL